MNSPWRRWTSEYAGQSVQRPLLQTLDLSLYRFRHFYLLTFLTFLLFFSAAFLHVRLRKGTLRLNIFNVYVRLHALGCVCVRGGGGGGGVCIIGNQPRETKLHFGHVAQIITSISLALEFNFPPAPNNLANGLDNVRVRPIF